MTRVLPGNIFRLPALQLFKAVETAHHVRLILTGTVDEPSLGHLRADTKTRVSIHMTNIAHHTYIWNGLWRTEAGGFVLI